MISSGIECQTRSLDLLSTLISGTPMDKASIGNAPCQDLDPQDGKRFVRRVLAFGPVLMLFVCLGLFIWTGLRGIDCWIHGDEINYQIAPVKTMIKTSTLLPGFYGYPSLDYWINLAVLTPDALREAREARKTMAQSKSKIRLGLFDSVKKDGSRTSEPPPEGTIKPSEIAQQLETRLLSDLDQPAYVYRCRIVYMMLTSLTLIWVFLTVVVLGRTNLEALAATAILGTSWELEYHSRWIASDCILVQFSALTMLLLACVLRSRAGRKWLLPAAIAAGLGFGTKYTGGLLLIPVMLAAYATRDRSTSAYQFIRLIIKLVVAFATAYLLTTPGTILQPVQFVKDLVSQFILYRGGLHWGHSISPGITHARKIGEYLTLVLFSPYRSIALVFFLLGVVGIFSQLRKEPWATLILVAFPALLFVSLSRQGIMLVRNYLPMAPILAVFSASGLFWLLRILEKPALKMSLGVGIVLALGANAAWLVQTSRTIEQNSADLWVHQAADYIRSQPRVSFFLSEKVRSRLRSIGEADLPNLVIDANSSTVVLLYATEGFPDWVKWPGDPSKSWPANQPGLFLTWFGTYDCNLDCYPMWHTGDTIVALTTSRAFAIGVRPVTGSQPVPASDGDRGSSPKPDAPEPSKPLARRQRHAGSQPLTTTSARTRWESAPGISFFHDATTGDGAVPGSADERLRSKPGSRGHTHESTN